LFVFCLGVFSGNISIGIAPDNEPELDEQFVVRLVSVVEGLPQMIESTTNEASVTIMENDNPGGTFSFSDASKGPFFITESTFAFVTLYVQRTGGDLVTRELMYSIVGGDGQFNDIRGKLIFFKGKRLDTIVISPIDDDIPELNKTYTVQLTSLGSETAVLGSRTSVDVTILQNDDANGVISFKKPAIVTFGEPSLNSTNASTVYLTVVRAGGVFGEIIVTWNVTTIGFSPPPSTQLMQVQGSVMFADGANITQITVSALADDVRLYCLYIDRGVSVLDAFNTCFLPW
jgi:G-protein coupled receptor 98